MDPIDSQQLLSQALSKAPKKPSGRDPKQLKQAAQQFEAIFLRQMFKEMRATIPDGGLIKRGNADAIFTDLQDAQAAQMMAARGGIGLTDLMMQQLTSDKSAADKNKD